MEKKLPFICGIVEGFYGRPWSMEQRMVLFKWMQKWGLNVYMYGPKDDLKHRLLWRETYSVEESAQLKALVLAAQDCGVEFVYAISPGQDITFSSSCDLTLLKQKLRQVKGFGCMAFAILFDDIDHTMCPTDKEAFSSFAHAQVSVSNEIYQYLGEPPVFLFCPTEYCGSLCYPSLNMSNYLKIIGDNLHPGIGIIWTGSTVISKEISAESVAEVQEVIKRRPLIWDNLHANDYAQRRVFLGPYKGRPSSLVSKLQGILLNPNCELEANYVPIHTLGTWYKCGLRAAESNTDEGAETCQMYCPNEALKLALVDWLKEVNRPLCPSRQLPKEERAGGLVIQPTEEVILNGKVEPDTRKPGVNSDPQARQNALKESVKAGETPPSRDQGHEGSEVSGSQCPVTVVSQEAESEDPGPRESGTQNAPEAPGNLEEELAGSSRSTDRLPEPVRAGDGSTEVADGTRAAGSPGQVKGGGRHSPDLTLDDLRLMVDLFHLPYEHGEETARRLREFQWLKANTDYVEEWRARAQVFQLWCDGIVQLYRQFMRSSNRAIVYDLYPYLWDIRNTLLVVKTFVLWLDGRIEKNTYSFNSWMNCFQWCRTNNAPVVLGTEGEPWIYRGGLVGEFQMMLPITSSSELFNQPPPIFPTLKAYTIRPFDQKDKRALYSMCLESHICKTQEKDHASCHPDLVGDRFLGHFLTLCPDYCFVLEDEHEVCGCVSGALEVKAFLKGTEAVWLPAMQEKYSKPTALESLTPTQELMMFFYRKTATFSDSLLYHFPSLIQVDVHPKMSDPSEARNLVICVLSALKANGSQGVFCELKATDKKGLEFHLSLGFLELPGAEASTPQGVILGRLL
ncbi:protein O-GlcNAcase isoform X2 [Pristis pectinata]|uniref:protein O-GlcNAcase isoform X2 n=1 Tax=Pristis pectinata TaxID=685728 RepID=UPI00223DE52B|nr:protein O-GlcNAcase isoform X2 [Pristis pectinata]